MGFANTHPLIFMKVCISKVHLFELDKNTTLFKLKINKTGDRHVILPFLVTFYLSIFLNTTLSGNEDRNNVFGHETSQVDYLTSKTK